MKIEPKIMSQVKSILGEFGNKYLTSKGSLKRNNVINDLDKFDHVLMTKLFKDPLIHKNCVEKIADAEVFKLNGSGAKFTQGECILYHELKLEVFR